jgi:hypothetical protein
MAQNITCCNTLWWQHATISPLCALCSWEGSTGEHYGTGTCKLWQDAVGTINKPMWCIISALLAYCSKLRPWYSITEARTLDICQLPVCSAAEPVELLAPMQRYLPL